MPKRENASPSARHGQAWPQVPRAAGRPQRPPGERPDPAQGGRKERVGLRAPTARRLRPPLQVPASRCARRPPPRAMRASSMVTMVPSVACRDPIHHQVRGGQDGRRHSGGHLHFRRADRRRGQRGRRQAGPARPPALRSRGPGTGPGGRNPGGPQPGPLPGPAARPGRGRSAGRRRCARSPPTRPPARTRRRRPPRRPPSPAGPSPASRPVPPGPAPAGRPPSRPSRLSPPPSLGFDRGALAQTRPARQSSPRIGLREAGCQDPLSGLLRITNHLVEPTQASHRRQGDLGAQSLRHSEHGGQPNVREAPLEAG